MVMMGDLVITIFGMAICIYRNEELVLKSSRSGG